MNFIEQNAIIIMTILLFNFPVLLHFSLNSIPQRYALFLLLCIQFLLLAAGYTPGTPQRFHHKFNPALVAGETSNDLSNSQVCEN